MLVYIALGVALISLMISVSLLKKCYTCKRQLKLMNESQEAFIYLLADMERKRNEK